MSQELTGAPVAQAVMEGLRPRIAALARDGVSPKLAIVRVGERSGDLSYERGACKRCSSLGIEVEKIVLPGDTPQIQLEHAIECVSGDGSVHGCPSSFARFPGRWMSGGSPSCFPSRRTWTA